MKRILIKGLMAGALLMSIRAGAQSSNIKFTEYTLPNGMHVILHEDHSTPIVAVSVMFHVGSKNEDPKRTGFAHFFEHLLFEGSENIGRGEYMKMVQAAGGQLNANTTQDRTYYYEVLPSNQLELAMWMESERMSKAKIDDIGVETQRKVVKEEKKQRYDNTPYGQILPVVLENVFQKHPYRWSPIGQEQYIDQAALTEFMDFYKTFYVPENATLSIGGDLDIAQTKQWVDKYFASIPKGTKPIPRPTDVEPEQTEEKRVEFFDNVQLPAVILAYHIPKQGSEDYYSLQLVNQLLSQGKSSRLQKAIVDQQQKALAVGAFGLQQEDPGVAMMFGIVSAGISADTLEAAMLAEVDKVVNNQISDEEYSKLMNQAENDFISQNQRIAGVVENLATYHVFLGDANLINTELDRYRKVTKADLQAAARKYYGKNNRTVIHYLPKGMEKKG
jgi:zinc protease